jgi:hypothetical protein
MVCASPLNLGFCGFTSVETLSSSSIKLWESQTIMTTAWLHTSRTLESWRSLTASSSTISSDKTMRWLSPSPGSGRAMNHPSGCVHVGFVQAFHPTRAGYPGTSPGEDSPVPAQGTPPGKDGPTLTFEVNSGAPTDPMKLSQEPGGEIATVVGPLDPDVDWQKPISEYLRLGTISDDKTETRCLTCWAKGYLIHNDELYHLITLGVFQ